MDAVLFVESAKGWLERVFADAEFVANRFGRSGIVEWDPSPARLKREKDLVRERGHSFVTDRVEAQVDLAMKAELTDKPLHFLTDGERSGKVAVVEEAAVGILDDSVVPDGVLAVMRRLTGRPSFCGLINQNDQRSTVVDCPPNYLRSCRSSNHIARSCRANFSI